MRTACNCHQYIPCTSAPWQGNDSDKQLTGTCSVTTIAGLQTLLHTEAHEEGGLAMNNRALLEQQRSAIYELVRDMGRQLMTGHVNLVNMSMPVKMFEPRSYLEKLSDVWVHSSILAAAAACDDSTLRLKWVVTW